MSELDEHLAEETSQVALEEIGEVAEESTGGAGERASACRNGDF